MNRRLKSAAIARQAERRADRADARRDITTESREPGWGNNPNADGLCLCGCGRRTRLAPRNINHRGILKNRPLCYIDGHNARKPSPAMKEHQFVPGQSGNPVGRPPGSVSIVTMLKKQLDKIEPKSRKTYAELFVRRWTADAIAGKPHAFKALLERLEGAVPQTIDVTVRNYDELSPSELAAEDARLAAELDGITAALAAAESQARAAADRGPQGAHPAG